MAKAIKLNGQKLDPKPTRREFVSWLSQVETKVNQLDKLTNDLAGSNRVMWSNQKELSKSEELLDEQFAVSTRMTITWVNKLSSAVNLPELKITEKDVEQLFRDWAKFRKRPDFREFMMEWFLGVALDKLPPPPQAKKEGDGHEADHRNESAGQEQPQDSRPGQAVDVPPVQEEDGAKTDS